MLRNSGLWAALFIMAALPCGGGEPAGPQIIEPGGKSDDNEMFKQLFKEVREKGLHDSQEGKGTVPASKAAICQICLQPLYKHADPNFVCVPPDKHALVIQAKPVECPVCHAHFIGALRGNINSKGGIDKDFCIHSMGKYAVHSKVWICPDCGYAALIDGFSSRWDKAQLDEATITFVREKLSAPMRRQMMAINGLNAEHEKSIQPDLLKFSTYVLQQDIPDWLKYDHALQIYLQQHAPHALLATLYVEGAHAFRREVCGEVAVPGLHNSVEAALSTSIRRVNAFILQEVLVQHRQSNESVVDPAKAETDPKAILVATQNILQKADAEPPPPANAPPDAKGKTGSLWVGDRYVLLLRQAGALDRLGRLKEAEAALEKASQAIPGTINLGPEAAQNRELAQYFERQLGLLREAAAVRLECVKGERDYLFKAAKNYMSAFKFKELLLKVPGQPEAGKDQRVCDSAKTAYLLGEMLRRADALPEAAAWFDAASRLCIRSLELLKQAAPKNPPTAEIDLQAEDYDVLQAAAQEQRALFKTAEPPDAVVREVIEFLLKSSGLDAAAPASAERVPAPAQVKLDAPAVAAPATAETSRVKTREQLYKLYYEALLRFRQDKKENPAKLLELVEGKYIPAEDAHLNEKGRLICPETQEWIGYQHLWTPGDASVPILYPVKPKPGSKNLYANGEIRESGVAR